MARGGNKLTKLKSVLKKLNSFNSNNPRSKSSISTVSDSSSGVGRGGDNNLHTVYVGKSRRRYLISSDVIGNPLFRELANNDHSDNSISVSCEVVLFEHLLWMLENADPQPDSLYELVEFYAC